MSPCRRPRGLRVQGSPRFAAGAGFVGAGRFEFPSRGTVSAHNGCALRPQQLPTAFSQIQRAGFRNGRSFGGQDARLTESVFEQLA